MPGWASTIRMQACSATTADDHSGPFGKLRPATDVGVPTPARTMQLKRLELLQRMPIFGGIRDEVLEHLVEMARPCRVAAGDYYFREGDQAEAMYVLEAGRAAVLKSWQGRHYLLRHLELGDCFGEMALIDLLPRSASVRAAVDCIALELTPGNLHRLFEHDSEQFTLIQMNIGRELSRRLRATDELLFRASMGERSAPDDNGVFRST